MDRTINDITHIFIEHLTKRNLSNLVALFSDRIDWFIPGDTTKAPWLGVRSTKAEIEDFFRLLWKNTDPVAAEIYDIFYQKNNAVIAGEFSTKMLTTGKIVTSIFFIHITEKDGFICRYRLLEDSFSVSKSLIS
jgi:uncharacterized protein